MYEFKGSVNFGENIQIWQAGIVYGKVAEGEALASDLEEKGDKALTVDCMD